MSNEPGVTLGRLIAAERNALTAMQLAKLNLTSQEASTKLIEKQAKQIQQLHKELAELRVLVVRSQGVGPTA